MKHNKTRTTWFIKEKRFFFSTFSSSCTIVPRALLLTKDAGMQWNHKGQTAGRRERKLKREKFCWRENFFIFFSTLFLFFFFVLNKYLVCNTSPLGRNNSNIKLWRTADLEIKWNYAVILYRFEVPITRYLMKKYREKT